jgi:hypothetical protein
VERTGDLLGLTETEAALVTQLRRGVALWKVGQRSFLVEHRLSAEEEHIIDTDAAMVGATAGTDPMTSDPLIPDPMISDPMISNSRAG